MLERLERKKNPRSLLGPLNTSIFHAWCPCYTLHHLWFLCFLHCTWFSPFGVNEKSLFRYAVWGIPSCTCRSVNLGYNGKALIIPLWDPTRYDLLFGGKCPLNMTIMKLLKALILLFLKFLWQEGNLPCSPPSLSQPISVWLNSIDNFESQSKSDFLQKASKIPNSSQLDAWKCHEIQFQGTPFTSSVCERHPRAYAVPSLSDSMQRQHPLLSPVAVLFLLINISFS